MRILHGMFARGLGGIEQAFVNYTVSMLKGGHEVFCVISKGAAIKARLNEVIADYPKKLHLIEVSNYGKFDIINKAKIKQISKAKKIDIFFAHGNRSISFFLPASKALKLPLVAVAHNYSYKYILKCDYIFSITNHLKNFLISKGFSQEKIFITPNSLDYKVSLTDDTSTTKTHCTSTGKKTIGVMARFVPKKGVDVFLHACGALKDKGHNFQALIAGTGDEMNKLQALRDNLGLSGMVKFIGWVHNQNDFYSQIDVFCLPSLHEPFGIVILEAMSQQKPIVSTKTEGPVEILSNNEDALLVEVGHAGELAIALEKILLGEVNTNELAASSYKKLTSNYTHDAVSKIINAHLTNVKCSKN